MTDEFDVKKLTDDAFMAIDALFTDEDDMFSEKEDKKQPDDFELMQEYMLALDWECSDKNFKKFNDFLKKITPKYSGKHNQDILKMLTSIVRYLENSKDKALSDTHQVLEFIIKTFKDINQAGTDEETIRQAKTTAYNQVLDLKSKIAKVKRSTPQEVEMQERSQIFIPQPEVTQKSEPVPKPEVVPQPKFASQQEFELQSEVSANVSQTTTEAIESSAIILSLMARLELCENRLASIDTQNIKLQQKISELTSLNNQINDNINNQINNLESKLSEQIDELSQVVASLPTTSNVEQDIDVDNLSLDNMDNLVFNTSQAEDDDPTQYDEINFDGIDFDEMNSDSDNQIQSNSGIENNLNEVSLDEIEFSDSDYMEQDMEQENDIRSEQNSLLEIDFEQINPDTMGIVENIDSNVSFEEVTLDDISYDEITADDLQYDNADNLMPNVATAPKEKYVAGLNQTGAEEKQNHPDDAPSIDKPKNNVSEDISESEYLEDTPQYVRCFKVDEQVIALPDDKIYNTYKIPSKLTKTIHNTESLLLGDFSSFFQKLSKNMKGYLNQFNSGDLKNIRVDVHLLTKQNVDYKIVILCSFNNKLSIIPVTDIYETRTRPTTGLKHGQNRFSDYNVNIVDIGTIPFLPLFKK
ncbi:MAG: hypothetical protein HQK67_01800 [Desulfamplus sp.]|nr:hypothetical protein [Desulfamplus sp.]